MTRCVLVTGATGFLGSALVRRLAARGDEVHAVARSSSDRAAAPAVVRWHEGDLLDATSLERAVAAFAGRAKELGARAEVVHAAAVISYRTGDRELQRRANVDGTRSLLEACRAAGVERVVHTSSVVTVGTAPSAHGELDETADFNGGTLGCDYVDTKREAEEIALAASDELEIVVVNPGAVFGAGPGGAARVPNTARFVATVLRSRLAAAFAPPGGLSVVGVEDVAGGIVLALDRGRPGRRYLLTESNVALSDLYRAVLELAGRAPRVWAVPPALWTAVRVGASALDRVRRLELATPQSLALLGVHFRCSSARARAELGWMPRPFREVLEHTIDWLRGRGELGPVRE